MFCVLCYDCTIILNNSIYIYIILQARAFLVPKLAPKACLCQEVVAFNVPASAEFIGAKPKASAWRRWIRASNIGCNDKKLNISGAKQLTCSHVRRSKLDPGLVAKLDKGGCNFQGNYVYLLKCS